ncbi:MAG: electron transfer flavoprotein subunit alpha/FixB family protein [Micrococcales bacterium]|nr:electron transfer flavoprotein subunit alpha/FixB family protein [Micrococcales bacterium]
MNESTQDVLVLVDGDAAVAGPVAVARAAVSQTPGATVTAVVVGARSVADAVAASGVDRVLWLGDAEGAPAEAWAGAVADAVAQAAPRLVVAPARDGGRALAGAVAARCGAPVLTGVTEVTLEDGAVVVQRDVHGGIAVRTERVTGGPAVLTVAPGGSSEPVAPVAVEEAGAAPSAAVRVREERASGREAVDLGGARVVVGIGRGLKAREDLAIVERLAAALGGEVACSRPLAEGHDWLTKDRYIGISGQHVAPDLYVAAGISGQVQHMVGVAGAKVVVAINSDPDAPVFAQCDHGVVGDLYAVLPALAAALEA